MVQMWKKLQKVQRTPIHFVGEEKKHLDHMLKAGVIQPSSSEWAAPPVLVRKKDGNVRWCIGYQQLNKVTKKEVQRGPYYSGGPRGGPNNRNRGGSGGASQRAVQSVVSRKGGTAAAPRPAGGSRVVTSTQGAGSYAAAVAEGRRTVVSRGVAGRGSAATCPTGGPGRGKSRGVTVAQSPAQRDAR